MAWKTEIITIVRNMINDLTTPYQYSDVKLQETVLVAAGMVQYDVDLANSYTIDVDQLTLTPDPTVSPRDTDFIHLIALKTGCIVDLANYRAKLLSGGIVVRDGPTTIDTTKQLGGAMDIIKSDKGWCEEYNEAILHYQMGTSIPGRAILGPFSSPNVNTDYGGPYLDNYNRRFN